MRWSRKSSREGQAHRRPDLESLEARQLLSLTDPVPASSPSSFLKPDGSVAFDQVIQAGSARSGYGVDGSGENVAVIDTGVDYRNPAFGSGGVGQPGNKVVAGVDFTGSPNGVLPTWQHGTGVAGLIASNDPRSPGIAPGAGIVALRVFGDNNQGSFDTIAKALDWVVQNHDQYKITAVNMSISDGKNYQSNLFAADGSVGQAITTSVKALESEDIPVVVAAGNNFDGKTQGEGFASIIPDTISVTATDESKMTSPKANDPLAADAQRLGESQGGVSATDIAAPGVNLDAPWGPSGTATEEGTSFAAPQVTGTVVLLQQAYQRAFGKLPTVARLDGWLQAGAVTVHDNVTGIDIGRLDVANSLKIESDQIQAAALASAAQAAPTPPPVIPALIPLAHPVIPVAPAPTPVATPAPVPIPPAINQGPMTEVFINGESVGSVSTAQLSGTYSGLFALTGGVAKNLRAWAPAGSMIDLGASKPSGSVLPPKTVVIPTRGGTSRASGAAEVSHINTHPVRTVAHLPGSVRLPGPPVPRR